MIVGYHNFSVLHYAKNLILESLIPASFSILTGVLSIGLMDHFYDLLQKCISNHQPNFGDGESVLTLLYEAYSECNRLDDVQIKSYFEELYRQMNGMELREMDKIIYPVCKLCRDHEQVGFVEGLKIGVMLAQELNR